MPDKVKIGFIGSGFARSTQAPAFALFENASLYAVASPTGSRREKFANEFQIPHRFEDWRNLVESDVDLVCITTPPNLHAEIAIAALQNGKHVICEKPFAMTVPEAEKMQRCATAYPKQLAVVDHELRLLPTVRLMREFVQNGRLGTLYGMRAEVVLSSRNNPDRKWNWWSDKVQGGGAMGAVGSHLIDLCHYLIGEIESCLASYHVLIPNRPGQSGEPVPVTSDDAFDLMVKFSPASKAPLKTGHISVTTVDTYTSFRFEVIGSNGTLRMDGEGNLHLAEHIDKASGRSMQGNENFVRIFPELTPDETDVIGKREKSALEKQGIFAKAFTHLAATVLAVLSNKQYEIVNAATFNDGLKCQRVMAAASESAISGCWCNV